MEELKNLNECLALENDIELNENFRDNDEWDSMCEIIMLTCLEENFSIKLSSEELKKFNTVEEIFNAKK